MSVAEYLCSLGDDASMRVLEQLLCCKQVMANTDKGDLSPLLLVSDGGSAGGEKNTLLHHAARAEHRHVDLA